METKAMVVKQIPVNPMFIFTVKDVRPTCWSRIQPAIFNQLLAYAQPTTPGVSERYTWLQIARLVSEFVKTGRQSALKTMSLDYIFQDILVCEMNHVSGVPNYRKGFDVYDASTGIEEDISKVVIKDGEVRDFLICVFLILAPSSGALGFSTKTVVASREINF